MGEGQVRASLERYLREDLKHRTTGRDPKLNGYAYAEIPDWHLRQMIEALATSPSPPADVVGALRAALEECREYFDDRMDVVDGDNGQPRPNREMQLVQMIDEALGRKP